MLELYINDGKTAVGRLNLPGDEPLSLNINSSDVRDISKRNSTFSQTFTMLADANNNILLNHIYNLGSDSSFDRRKKTPCYILVDGVEVFRGNFQLTDIVFDNTIAYSYECVVYGDVVDLIKTLGDKLLVGNADATQDLDFTSLNHIFNVDTIINSWTADTKTLGYYYPLIDYGYNLTFTKLNQEIPLWGPINGVVTDGGCNPMIFKPAISNTWLFKNILNQNGFYTEGTFLDSDVFAETIIPFNGSSDPVTVIDQALVDSTRFKASLTDAVPGVPVLTMYGDGANSISNTPIFPLVFNNDSTLGNFDTGGTFDITTGKYTSPITVAQELRVTLRFKLLEIGVHTPNPIIVVRFFRSTQPTFAFYQDHKPATDASGNGVTISGGSLTIIFSSTILDNPASPSFYPPQPGETFWCDWQIYGLDSTNNFQQLQVWNSDCSFTNLVHKTLLYDGLIEYKDWVPKNIKQVDYIKSVILMFNLMVIPNKYDDKKLLFIPRDEYYATGTIKNWTNKLDEKTKPRSKAISDLQNRTIKFSYKEDKDWFNTYYKENWQRIYGDFVEYVDNEWVEGEKKIDVIFSPTPVTKVGGSSNIFTPVITKKSSTGSTYNKTDSNIRFLVKRKSPLTSTDHIKMVNKPLQYSYPYCGHLDHPLVADLDYNFGQILQGYYDELTVLTPNTLVETYWRTYLDIISDKNSSIVKCKLYLTANDIEGFRYNDILYIDGISHDGGHYFIVNKITYIPTSNQPSEVELLKIDTKPKERLRFVNHTYSPIGDMGTLSALEVGSGNTIKSTSLVVGTDNIVGTDTDGTVILNGSNNRVIPGVRNTILINTNNQLVTEDFVTIIGNTYFGQDGSVRTLYNDIDSGLDCIMNPFSASIINDIDSGLNAVRNLGGSSVISDIDSGQDGINI